jgi:general secretion pathway protein E
MTPDAGRSLALLRPRKLLGQMLKEGGHITESVLGTALSIQEEKGGLLGHILVGLKAVTEEDLTQALAAQLNLPFLATFEPESVDPMLVTRISIQYARQHLLLPLKEEGGELVVASSDPLALEARDDLQSLYGIPIRTVLCPREKVLAGVNRVFDRLLDAEKVMGSIDKEGAAGPAEEEDDDELGTRIDIIEENDEAPIIRLVNSIIRQAVKEQSSDIHVEPMETFVSVRFRKDGVLREVLQIPKKLQAGVSSRIKIMGNLNIAEKRLPQDGRIRKRIAGTDVDFRLSTVPTTHGERAVLRILDRTATVLKLEDLGFDDNNLTRFERLIQRPHGILLVTGPTGSGKTTTLYAALSRINTPDKNILTIEDPVEYQLQGVGQMQVNSKIEFTFANGLRSILRQDPDVVLVGEVRDAETAEIAVQASLTGHLVFSTLHTNDSASSFTRLIDIGTEPFLIASSVIAVMAQRLVRRVCKHCREPYTPSDFERGELPLLAELMAKGEIKHIYRATGCRECRMTGYRGRLGIYELLTVTDEIRSLVVRRVDATIIKKEAVKEGMLTLRDDGALKIARGATTVEEVLRVTQDDLV